MDAPWFLLLLALVAGAGIAMQAGVNAQLGKSLGDPVLAAFVSFGVGTLTLALVLLVVRPTLPALEGLGSVPTWAWTGGLLGAFFVTVAIFVAPRLGAGALLATIVAAQLVTALLLDHFGFLGFAERAITVPRVVGAALLGAGVWLIRFF